jgi:hypothetical protein
MGTKWVMLLLEPHRIMVGPEVAVDLKSALPPATRGQDKLGTIPSE